MTRSPLWQAVVLFGCSLLPARAQAAAPIGPVQYSRLVHACRVQLDAAISPPAPVRSLACIETLRSLTIVTIPGARTIQTDMSMLAAGLADQRGQLSPTGVRVIDHLDDFLRASAATSSPPRSALEQSLHDSRIHSQPGVRERLKTWLLNVLGWLLAHLQPQSGTNPWIAAAVAGVLLVVAGSLAYFFGRRGLRSMPAGVGEEVLGVATSAEALQHAASLAQTELYRDALHYLFRAVLLSLQETSLLVLVPGRTNRECLEDLRGNAEVIGRVGPPLRELVRSFDEVWYGRRDITAGRYHALEAVALRIIDLSRERAA